MRAVSDFANCANVFEGGSQPNTPQFPLFSSSAQPAETPVSEPLCGLFMSPNYVLTTLSSLLKQHLLKESS